MKLTLLRISVRLFEVRVGQIAAGRICALGSREKMGKSGKKQRQQQKPPRGSYFPQEEDDEGHHQHYHYSDETLQSSSRGINIEDDKEVEDEDEVQEEDGADPNPLTDDMPSKFLLYQQSVQVTTHS